MFITPAYAQSGAMPGPDMLISILPFVLIFVIMYFLIIRPQRQQMKKRAEMLNAIRRGDTVVTGGGLVGKVTKVTNDDELEVDLGNGMKVTVVRSLVSEVRVKGEPVANQNAKSSQTGKDSKSAQGAKSGQGGGKDSQGSKSTQRSKSQGSGKDSQDAKGDQGPKK